MLPSCRTELSIGHWDGLTEEEKVASEEWYAKILLGDRSKMGIYREGEAEDAANGVIFLVSHMAKFITGQMLCVDGGFVMVR